MPDPTSRRHAKIIATLGPAVDTLDGVRSLIAGGLDVARLNFSHGTAADHARRLGYVRQAATEARKPVAVLQDLQGPKIRLGAVEPRSARAAAGDSVELVQAERATYPELAIAFEGIVSALETGDRVLLDDGRISLRITAADGERASCVVEHGGPLRDRVGVHVPAHKVASPALTEKDLADLAFGLDHGVDYVALSFVREAQDLKMARAFCAERGRVAPLVAKIETPPAIDNLEAIVREADALMVARGDLGVEFQPEMVPVLQRRILRLAHRHHKPVIVATEMLQSMVRSPRPTRAEASDVAHAVFDGADAVMLSAETATGEHPALAVSMMSRIIESAEGSIHYGEDRAGSAPRGSVAESIAFNAADIADEIDAAALVVLTESGETARLVASARPGVPIIAFSPDESSRRRLALCWGVHPYRTDGIDQTADVLQRVVGELTDRNLVKVGESFVAVFALQLTGGSRAPSVAVCVAE